MTWVCQECGSDVTQAKIEEILEQQLEDGEGAVGKCQITLDSDIEKVSLLDCPNCDAELAVFEKDTSEPEEPSDGHSKSEEDATQASEQSSSNQPFSVV